MGLLRALAGKGTLQGLFDKAVEDKKKRQAEKREKASHK